MLDDIFGNAVRATARRPCRLAAMHDHGASASAAGLPWHVGFAGSRFLFEPGRLEPARARTLEAALLPVLIARLAELPQRLDVAPSRPVCGLSQVAIGADTLFTRACAALGWRQQVLLPQAVDAFLAAGEPAEPDFTPDEQAAARALLRLSHIESVRVASQAHDRVVQFEDTNAAILAASDAIVCLVREGAHARPGGTRDLMQRAALAGKPVGLLQVALRDGVPQLSSWSMS